MVIEAEALRKVYRVADKKGGLGGAVSHLFHPQFRQIEAVTGVSFKVEKGEIVGYLGSNGSGKSTTLKMLTGTLMPTSGSVSVLGYKPYAQRSRYVRHIGALFGQRTQLWWDLPVIDSFNMLAGIYGIETADLSARLAELDEGLSIKQYLRRSARQLSLGERMRCEIAAILLHSPEVVFLDEPTIGLDINAKHGIRTFLTRMNEKYGTTVMLSSHDLGDVERLCDRVLVIDHGTLVFDGSLERLRDLMPGRRRLTAKYAFPVEQERVNVALAEQSRSGNLEWKTHGNQEVEVSLDGSEGVGWLVDVLRGIGAITDLRVEEPSIEELLRQLYGVVQDRHHG